MTRDNDIIVIPCVESGRRIPLTRLSVDDFSDPDEIEIGAEEINLTLVECGPEGEVPGACLSLSVTSARELVRRLNEAIRRREPAGGGPWA